LGKTCFSLTGLTANVVFSHISNVGQTWRWRLR
jgi:hypothetical protein